MPAMLLALASQQNSHVIPSFVSRVGGPESIYMYTYAYSYSVVTVFQAPVGELLSQERDPCIIQIPVGQPHVGCGSSMEIECDP